MVYLDESERVDLEEAARRFHGQWSRYLHLRKIPELNREGIINAVDPREDGDDIAVAASRPKAKLVKNIPFGIADTGCGNDLLSKDDASKTGIEVHLSKRWLTFITANGKTRTNVTCPLRLKELEDAIKPYALDSTPPVLSVGRRVRHGFQFHWTSPTVRHISFRLRVRSFLWW